MNLLQRLKEYLKQKVKYSAVNPSNFEELWSFHATRIQIISLISLLCIVLGILAGLLTVKGPFASYFSKNDVSIERKKLEEQHNKIKELNQKLITQEKYFETIKMVLRGESPEDADSLDVPETASLKSPAVDAEPTSAEKELSQKVKSDLRTRSKKKANPEIPFFSAPVKGVISQKFDSRNHPAIDIVTSRDKTVLACLSGTVIYSGYTYKDGFVLILEHANGYLTVYKHNKTVLKKTGNKVHMNDPIAIVGNSGENSKGPHLHFELWYNQSAVDPEKYIDFN